MRLENRQYRFDFTLPANAPMSLPEIERLHMQASVAMMQASDDQHVQMVDSADGKAYRIDVPRVDAAVTNAVWDLNEAHALIDADDYRILELSVKGAFLKQPYSISFRLIRRSVTSGEDVPATDFEIPETADAIRFRGEGSAIPARDAFLAALREVARVTQER
jgi:predicted lipase